MYITRTSCIYSTVTFRGYNKCNYLYMTFVEHQVSIVLHVHACMSAYRSVNWTVRDTVYRDITKVYV